MTVEGSIKLALDDYKAGDISRQDAIELLVDVLKLAESEAYERAAKVCDDEYDDCQHQVCVCLVSASDKIRSLSAQAAKGNHDKHCSIFTTVGPSYCDCAAKGEGT